MNTKIEKSQKHLIALDIGTKIRMVQTNSTGTIVGKLHKSTLDGADRIPVRWDNSGITNSWNPIFLRHADTSPNEDPETVSDGSVYREKGNITTKGNGIIVIDGGGFKKCVK